MIYVQDSGKLYDDDGKTLLGEGYSGHGEGLNNPDMQEVSNVGPIPVGTYFVGDPFDSAKHGPFVLPLTPDPNNEMFNRSAFEMHGDEKEHAGEFLASHGCIIMARAVREKVAANTYRSIRVIAHDYSSL